jgi:hypothetical protein
MGRKLVYHRGRHDVAYVCHCQSYPHLEIPFGAVENKFSFNFIFEVLPHEWWRLGIMGSQVEGNPLQRPGTTGNNGKANACPRRPWLPSGVSSGVSLTEDSMRHNAVCCGSDALKGAGMQAICDVLRFGAVPCDGLKKD